MRVVVLGATGEMGRRVSDLLDRRGHVVVPAARSTGVDATVAGSLVPVLRDADCVVDCLNVPTLSRRRAVRVFGGAARTVSGTARDAGVAHVVVVSIVGIPDPAVARATGYYAGKAAQEREYAAAHVPVTAVRSTAWFTLAETFLHQLRLGRYALVPRMGLVPVHPDAVAALVADTVEAGPSTGPAAADGLAVREVAGPEPIDATAMARALVAERHLDVRVVGAPAPGAGLRTGLLPGASVPRDGRRFADWLRTGGP